MRAGILSSPAALSERSPFGFETSTPPIAPTSPDDVSVNPRGILSQRAANIWDREHIGDTLLAVGSGLLSGHNFGDGLAGAAQGILSRQRSLRDDQRTTTSYGGPDDQFAITTDRLGNQTIREVPEFAAANKAKRDAAYRLKAVQPPKDLADMRGRAVHAISQLPPEQRSAAYADLMSRPEQYGVNVTGMPSTWTDQYGRIAGSMGMNVNQANNQDRGDLLADSRVARDKAAIAQGQERVDQGTLRLLKPPPSLRGNKPRSGSLKIGTQMGGFTYQGGDPSQKENWK